MRQDIMAGNAHFAPITDFLERLVINTFLYPHVSFVFFPKRYLNIKYRPDLNIRALN